MIQLTLSYVNTSQLTNSYINGSDWAKSDAKANASAANPGKGNRGGRVLAGSDGRTLYAGPEPFVLSSSINS